MIIKVGKNIRPFLSKFINHSPEKNCIQSMKILNSQFTNLGFYLNKIEKVYFSSSDCGEGDKDWEKKTPCEVPKGPCVPLKKPGYPPKAEVPQEPFCVNCPSKKPCNLNQCPTLEGTLIVAFLRILFSLHSKSQKSNRHEDANIRLQISTDLDASQVHDNTKTYLAIIKMACQQFLLIPTLPELSENLISPKLISATCLPGTLNCPLYSKKIKIGNLPRVPALKYSGGFEDVLKNMVGSFNKRDMSSDAKRFLSDSDSFKRTKCKTVMEMCAKRSFIENNYKLSECQQSSQTSCHPDRNKCPRDKKITKSALNIDQTKDSNRPFFEKNNRVMMVKNVKLPESPAQPVVLRSCPPPPKLQPGLCPCAGVFMSTRNELKLIVPSHSCPLKPKYPCPKSRIYHCSGSQRPKCQK